MFGSHLCICRNDTAQPIPKQNYNVLSPNSYTYISVRDLNVSRISLSILPMRQTDPGNHRSQIHFCRNWENEAGRFHFWEYINRIFGIVYSRSYAWRLCDNHVWLRYSARRRRRRWLSPAERYSGRTSLHSSHVNLCSDGGENFASSQRRRDKMPALDSLFLHVYYIMEIWWTVLVLSCFHVL